jgi:glycosyltransferase involved in cell wall biosynthesis
MRRIFITSYPYVYERYFRVFDYFREKEKPFFILPATWQAKGGKIRVKAPIRDDIKIVTTKALFSHSHYPIIRGLFKGWMPAAKRIIRQNAQPGDILYTAIEPNLLTTYFNSRLAVKLGLKHVFFTWQNVPYKKRLNGLKLKITEHIIKKTIKNSVGAICGNHKAAEILKTYASPNFKILIAPISGVDTEKFKPGIVSDFRQKNNLEDKIVLTFAGVFDNRKGIKTLLEAFAAALKEVNNLHLVMIGAGPLESSIQDFIDQNKLQSFTTLIPWLPNDQLPGVFSASDIFIHPSEPFGGWEEQFGYSMAEASASGLPVITTKAGSIGEIVLDGTTGVLIEPQRPDRLKGAITELVKDIELRKKMGHAGRRHIEENFSHRVIANKFYDFFSRLTSATDDGINN